jgi:glycosyltransferase involved in cell wall biosynthesis
MHLAVDGLVWHGHETGVGIATKNLVTQLNQSQFPINVTTFVSHFSTLSQNASRQVTHKQVVVSDRWRLMKRILWQHIMLPILVERHRVDVLYCPSYTTPLYVRRRTAVIVTVHDMIAWQRPDLCRFGNVIHLRALVEKSVRRAQGVTVPTHAVKADLLARINVSEEKVHVIPWGIRPELKKLPKKDATRVVKCLFGIDYPYILFVGNAEQHSRQHQD